MVHVTAEIKKWGNSLGIVIPSRISKKIGLQNGEKVDINIEKIRLIDGFGILKGAKSFREEIETHEKFQ